jgi:hypothetical protein
MDGLSAMKTLIPIWAYKALLLMDFPSQSSLPLSYGTFGAMKLTLTPSGKPTFPLNLQRGSYCLLVPFFFRQDFCSKYSSKS